MPRLEISLLGPFHVTLGGAPVSRFGADTARALLAYLAMAPHTPHRRETLAGLLWPDQPESEARHNLSQALLRLRVAIRDRDAVPPFLLATRETIQFSPESDYWLDVSAFEEAVAFTRHHGHRRAEDCAVCAEHLAEAVELYQDEFLAEFSLPSALFRGGPWWSVSGCTGMRWRHWPSWRPITRRRARTQRQPATRAARWRWSHGRSLRTAR